MVAGPVSTGDEWGGKVSNETWWRHPVGRLFSPRRTLLRIAADLLLSRQCQGCGETLHEGDPGILCWECRARLPLMSGTVCECCGDYATGVIEGAYLCPTCRAHPPGFDWARSAVHYQGVVQPIVRSLKYRQHLDCLEELTLWMLTLWTDSSRPPVEAEPDIVLGVPMSYLRLRARTYNQADGIAQEIARALHIRYRTRVLARTRATASQTTMNAKQRRENVREAFAVVRPRCVRGKSVLLVDDVMTTGATLSECARVLKGAGAKHVYCLSAARGG